VNSFAAAESPEHYLPLTRSLENLYLPLSMINLGRGHPPSGLAKRAIRDAAAALFAEKGFTATSTREICEGAGVTKPVLYYHFGSKEELYETLVQEAFNEYQREVRRASRRGRTTREKLIETLRGMLAFARRHRNEYRLAVRMVVAPERESPAIDFIEMSRADERLLTEILREGVRKGEVKGKPQQIASAIAGVAFSCVMGFLLTGRPALNRKLARDTINLLMGGCSRRIPIGK